MTILSLLMDIADGTGKKTWTRSTRRTARGHPTKFFAAASMVGRDSNPHRETNVETLLKTNLLKNAIHEGEDLKSRTKFP